nr:phosphate uptake regulator PhoU [Desulfurococcales archaeon]
RYVDETVSLCEELKNEITREAVLFIARYQPLGRELIQAENTIKASYDLYRITRYLREIAHLDRKVGPLSTLLTEHDWALLDQARTMLEKGYRLYRQGEGDAMEILEADNIIDRAYEEILDEISQSENVEKRKAVEALYRRHVERIADHIVYIVTKII